ncbi:Tex-like protein N-terminal domain protein [Segatella oris F0302]|uniref:Tex-like protein N-terminal domain protein n=1 Tax=Segatella oris F0302 TaxID=649760 RepID=D1QM51_9BACT|nr:Tex family protein [Segatella oris]EFB33274.1 Tex-like protein N-terminal domain protein [Segatella oris F0302]
MNNNYQIIAKRLMLPEKQVENTILLLNEGCTIPFIARYRKERTGSLDEVQIAAISEQYTKMQELTKRKDTICKTIEEQGKLTADLKRKIEATWDATELEDIYLPFKPKRRTKAQIARENGLEPLATILLLQREQQPEAVAKRFLKGDIKSVDEALAGAKDIIAEAISEDETVRQQIRSVFRREAVITSKAVKSKREEEGAQKFADYFEFSEPLKRCSSHRLLAMRRGESEGFLKVNIDVDSEQCTEKIRRKYVHGLGKCQQLVGEACDDAYKRLVRPSVETEFANTSKEAADEEAIKVFAENLRQLLLAAPLGQKRVMAVDPGIRTGCKVVCLSEQGDLLHHSVVYTIGNKSGNDALATFTKLVSRYHVEAIAVGNGTASRETTDILRQIDNIPLYVVSEDGASIYSASENGRNEFPDLDLTVRGAISIGRRLMDPLAELVKIDAKSIGVGQYQHDVNQTKLKQSLDRTVESCVNQVGVNLNTASKHLLTYVSGLGPSLAQNIVDYRHEHGAFASRSELKKVPRLGSVAYEQCAGFLRIPNARNPLDNSAVHPERYALVEVMAKEQQCRVSNLIGNHERLKRIPLQQFVTSEVGLPTLHDILKELEKPGLDPREQLEEFRFDERVHTVEDLIVGMELPGIVTNITNFGAFVDIGVHQDGLVHISQMADKFIKDPNEVVKLHQHVRVRVIEVDLRRKRIALSMRSTRN